MQPHIFRRLNKAMHNVLPEMACSASLASESFSLTRSSSSFDDSDPVRGVKSSWMRVNTVPQEDERMAVVDAASRLAAA